MGGEHDMWHKLSVSFFVHGDKRHFMCLIALGNCLMLHTTIKTIDFLMAEDKGLGSRLSFKWESNRSDGCSSGNTHADSSGSITFGPS